MPLEDLFLRATAWSSLAGWAASELALAVEDERRRAPARWAFTTGVLALFVHTGLALHFRHSWDQVEALRAIARQTEEVTGVAFGGGLFFNYAFLAVWAAEATVWWLRPVAYACRPSAVRSGSRAFFLFMFVNAAVVFGKGPIRVVGAVLLLMTVASWYRGRSQRGARA